MAAARPLEVVDVFSNLLRLEQAGIFHFMANADPYLNRGAAGIGRQLQSMLKANLRREGELTGLIFDLGGDLRPPPVSPEQQYMAYLSVGYLLPKLIQACDLTIKRYETALAAMPEGSEAATGLLKAHLTELHDELQVLRKAVPPASSAAIRSK